MCVVKVLYFFIFWKIFKNYNDAAQVVKAEQLIVGGSNKLVMVPNSVNLIDTSETDSQRTFKPSKSHSIHTL